MIEKNAYTLQLLANPDVKRWFENVQRRSYTNADFRIRVLRRFCERMKIDPHDMLKHENPRNLLLDYIAMRESEVTAGSIKTELKAVKSWLAWNHIHIEEKLQVRELIETPHIRIKVPPDQVILRRIFASASIKERAVVSFLAFSGLRPQVLADAKGRDGLRMKDLPELRIDGKAASFEKIPTLVVVRRELSKNGHSYFSFLGQEGCTYLSSYILRHIANGEKIESNSPVIAPSQSVYTFLRTIKISGYAKRSMIIADFKSRPYDLRHYFGTQLMLAEPKGFLRDWRVFMMGHMGDIEHVYTLNKHNLRDDVVEKMRDGYSMACEFLETSTVKESGPAKDEVLHEILNLFEFPPDEAAKIKPGELLAAIREKVKE